VNARQLLELLRSLPEGELDSEVVMGSCCFQYSNVCNVATGLAGETDRPVLFLYNPAANNLHLRHRNEVYPRGE